MLRHTRITINSPDVEAVHVDGAEHRADPADPHIHVQSANGTLSLKVLGPANKKLWEGHVPTFAVCTIKQVEPGKVEVITHTGRPIPHSPVVEHYVALLDGGGDDAASAPRVDCRTFIYACVIAPLFVCGIWIFARFSATTRA